MCVGFPVSVYLIILSNTKKFTLTHTETDRQRRREGEEDRQRRRKDGDERVIGEREMGGVEKKK